MINGENVNNINMNIKIQESNSINIYKVCKRAMDIVIGMTGVIVLCPIIAVVFIANKIEGDKGPIFFMQKRIGENGKLFRLYKFRTMVVDADKILMKKLKSDVNFREKYLNYRKIENDERITKIGNFLRKTSIDEFPQFINVLKGDMSFVGPRPYLNREKKDMGEYYNYIIKCKPGITGLWQVSGRSQNTFKERLKLDLEYYNNKGIWYDIKIILKTVLSVFKKEGAM
ncbi:MAG: sugar transferase [Clostridia bacterium]|nr:sugar transferase [Clostridia bacterium]MCI9275676.1 sugar transferase [Clostridia bacterium]